MNKLQLQFAIVIGKLLGNIIRLLHLGGGTAAPGLVANSIYPKLITQLSQRLPQGNIVITGTNGKTTTARMLSQILKTADLRVIHNRAGSNLKRGVVTTLIKNSDFSGKLNFDIGIWEVDEAVMPKIVPRINPKIIVILNLFRDQLDRYGEVDTVRKKWQKALSKLSKDTTIVLNADDPGIAVLKNATSAKTIFFGIDEKKNTQKSPEKVCDVKHCFFCSTKLKYNYFVSSHLGDFYCPKCSFKRPKPEIAALKIRQRKTLNTKIELKIVNTPLEITKGPPGIFNTYNVLSAIACSKVLKIKQVIIKKGIAEFESAFGRGEEIKIGDCRTTIFLIKNPTGANEVIKTISKGKNFSLFLLLNDKIADGEDVSWIWDVDFEYLKEKLNHVIVSGSRAEDLALRLKYSQVSSKSLTVEKNKEKALKKALDRKDDLYILPTYTALIEFKELLASLGHSKKFWQT